VCELGWVVYKASKISQRWTCLCSLSCGSKHILELWLGIGDKHVAFYGLWPGMTSLELWLGKADEHEELLTCGSGWRVLSVWVCWLWQVGWKNILLMCFVICLFNIYVMIIWAHPICLCLAMIVYAVHVSRGYCRWSWWDLESEWGYCGEDFTIVFTVCILWFCKLLD